MIGIIGAMDIEVDGLKKIATEAFEQTVSGIRFTVCKLFGKDAVIAKCGIGKVNAALCTEAMIITYKPDIIINTGVAGSLSPTLAIGDIVVATDLCQHDFDTSPVGDPLGLIPEVNKIKIPTDNISREKLAKAISALGINYEAGTVASGDQFVATKAQKDFIMSEFGALACEMEGGSIGQVCALNNTPFAVLRALSDSADEGSCEDYPSFCALAAERSIKVISEFIKSY